MYWRRRIALLLAARAPSAAAATRCSRPTTAAPARARRRDARRRSRRPGRRRSAAQGTAPSPLAVRLDDPRDPRARRVQAAAARRAAVRPRHRPRAVAAQRRARVLPIASLTKMMTALLVAERVPRGAARADHAGDAALHGLRRRAAAAREADRRADDAARAAAGVGQRRRDRARPARGRRERAPLRAADEPARAGDGPDLHALLVAERDPRRAATTRAPATSPRSPAPCCATPRLARIVARRSAVLPLPDQGRQALPLQHQPAAAGGATAGRRASRPATPSPPGRCLVATARRGRTRLGVVLLHSPDPGRQARRLLDRGFRANR